MVQLEVPEISTSESRSGKFGTFVKGHPGGPGVTGVLGALEQGIDRAPRRWGRWSGPGSMYQDTLELGYHNTVTSVVLARR